MTRIVRTTYRYKRPPRRKKPVALEVPAVVKAADPAKARKRASGQGREPPPTPEPANDDPKPAPPTAAESEPAVVMAPWCRRELSSVVHLHSTHRHECVASYGDE
jgi:hypothetical protein